MSALAREGKAEEAAANFRRALALEPDFLQALVELASLLATSAVFMAERVLETATALNQQTLAASARSRLEAYRRGKAFRHGIAGPAVGAAGGQAGSLPHGGFRGMMVDPRLEALCDE